MTFRLSCSRSLTCVAVALVAAGCATTRPPALAPSAALPAMKAPSDVLFWTPSEREAAFRAMDAIAPHRPVPAGSRVRPLPPGAPLEFDPTAFMEANHTAGLLVLQDGRVRLERYGLGFTAAGRWTSFSVAKSLTSTLVGVAIARGLIESVDTPIVRYLPELAGSGYDGVTVGQLLSMTSGVAWNEDYEDPQSDLARFFGERAVPPGVDPTLAYMKTLTRAAEPGTRWHYSTGETALVGVLLSRATGQHLTDFLSESIWRPWGMERDAGWMVDESGQEAGGCCVIATLRDWGRLGQFVLEGGVIDGRRVVREGWFAEATRRHADIGAPGRGYGYQWWTRDDGSFDAVGIFGQLLHVDPKRRLVVVLLSAWPTATSDEASTARAKLLERINAAVDAG